MYPSSTSTKKPIAAKSCRHSSMSHLHHPTAVAPTAHLALLLLLEAGNHRLTLETWITELCRYDVAHEYAEPQQSCPAADTLSRRARVVQLRRRCAADGDHDTPAAHSCRLWNDDDHISGMVKPARTP